MAQYANSLFLSTSPARGTTPGAPAWECTIRISIHVPREGDDFGSCCMSGWTFISIHVPREGDDRWSWARPSEPVDFYPRPPRGGRQELTL